MFNFDMQKMSDSILYFNQNAYFEYVMNRKIAKWIWWNNEARTTKIKSVWFGKKWIYWTKELASVHDLHLINFQWISVIYALQLTITRAI